MLKVLIVDDQPAVRTALETLFEVHGLPAVSVSSPDEALDLLATEDIGVVVQDMNFTQENTAGAEGDGAVPRASATLDPDMPVMLLTAWTLARDRGDAGQGGRSRLHRQAVGRRQAGAHGARTWCSCARSQPGEHAPARPGQRALRATLAEQLRSARRWSTPAPQMHERGQPGVSGSRRPTRRC